MKHLILSIAVAVCIGGLISQTNAVAAPTSDAGVDGGTRRPGVLALRVMQLNQRVEEGRFFLVENVDKPGTYGLLHAPVLVGFRDAGFYSRQPPSGAVLVSTDITEEAFPALAARILGDRWRIYRGDAG